VGIACSCNAGLLQQHPLQQHPLQQPAPSGLGLLMKPQSLLLEESRSMIQLRLYYNDNVWKHMKHVQHEILDLNLVV